jgi:hypothetical protein
MGYSALLLNCINPWGNQCVWRAVAQQCTFCQIIPAFSRHVTILIMQWCGRQYLRWTVNVVIYTSFNRQIHFINSVIFQNSCRSTEPVGRASRLGLWDYREVLNVLFAKLHCLFICIHELQLACNQLHFTFCYVQISFMTRSINAIWRTVNNKPDAQSNALLWIFSGLSTGILCFLWKGYVRMGIYSGHYWSGELWLNSVRFPTRQKGEM